MAKTLSKKFTAIVLAAGKGVRMRSSLPKVLHQVRGAPLIYHVLNQLKSLPDNIGQTIVVVGYDGKKVEAEVKKLFQNVEFVYQEKQLGTAHAVIRAKNKIKYPNVLILCADAPLIKKETLASFMAAYFRKDTALSLITANIDGKNELGRIIRDSENNVKEIREKITLDESSELKEVNSGIYAAKTRLIFEKLKMVKKNVKKGEYFLTDIVSLLYKEGYPIDSFSVADEKEILGINTVKELYAADKIMRERIIEELYSCGVKIIDPCTTFIDCFVKIGEGTAIYPFTFIEKNVIIGRNCSIGPFIRLRKGSRVADNTHLGNFLEVNRCVISKNVKAKHVGYLGDAIIKENANIGAGTVIANYDGKDKNKTLIGKSAFIGCDTVLIAPVKVGRGAVTGAGSVVTRNVKPDSVVVGVPAKFLKKRK